MNKKQEILEMLARKEISKEEAESKLQELGETTSEPGQPEPVQPVKPAGKSNKGCITGIIVASVAGLLFIILIVLGLVSYLMVEQKKTIRSELDAMEAKADLELERQMIEEEIRKTKEKEYNENR